MSTDPVVDELDRLRAEQMAQCNFDFESFYRDLKEQEKLLPQVVQASSARADDENPGSEPRPARKT